VPQLVMDDTKILSMIVENLHFLDSLANESKEHDQIIRPHMQKGYFPHFFNTAVNLYYVCPYPEPNLYGSDFAR
jgi:hypothetical protein